MVRTLWTPAGEGMLNNNGTPCVLHLNLIQDYREVNPVHFVGAA
jgi:hypothetical protein